ncbi:dihydrofolate reductase family protein [Bradyrhizobium guangzhouense]|uniref:Deaminase n=1 Tax=Bradyrhizobium guangzhouense TaxID=1325095 RepID=A0AAE5X7Y2_9BRAD|nr:dihydrofolate reductase family protein [Bradyrhizobium guangzhouense]QAU50296.1 deaminase [Bradyrhizobium guangzhouense]RXH15124.1 deaminase [Bradyrhizobium guangzhouense]
MRKLVLQMQMSTDGYFAVDKPVDWQLWGWGERCNWDDDLKGDFNSIFASIDCILLSRKMIEGGYLDHWGAAAKRYPADKFYAFAQRVVDVPKVVLTQRLTRSRWDRTVIAGGPLEDEVRKLKNRPERSIIAFGGIGLASSLLAMDLVEELQLFINPVILGHGASIFERNRTKQLMLLQSKAYPCGMVVNRYQPRPAR